MKPPDKKGPSPSGQSAKPTVAPDESGTRHGRSGVGLGKRRQLKATVSRLKSNSDGPNRVLVLSSEPGLALRLKAKLGSAIATAAASDLLKALQLVGRFEPRALVVDLVNPAPESQALTSAVLAELTDDVLVFFWGKTEKESSWRAVPAGRRGVWVDHSDGISPLVDHFRAMADPSSQ